MPVALGARPYKVRGDGISLIRDILGRLMSKSAGLKGGSIGGEWRRNWVDISSAPDGGHAGSDEFSTSKVRPRNRRGKPFHESHWIATSPNADMLIASSPEVAAADARCHRIAFGQLVRSRGARTTADA